MLWFALFFSFSLSWMLVIPVLAAIFHLLRLGQAVISTTVLASLLTTKCREVFLQARSKDATVTMLDQLFLLLWRIRKGVRPAPQIVTSKKMEFPLGSQVAVLLEERELLQPVPCLGMQVIPIRRIFLNARKAPLSLVVTQHLVE